MTTINNHESLIEKVGGIEKAKVIVGGAPSNAESYQGGYYFRESPQFMFHNGFHDQWNLTENNGLYFRSVGFHPVWIDDLRTAIAQHDKTWVEKRFGIKKWHPIPEHHMCTDKQSDQEFKVGDLVVKTHPKNTILWPVLGVYKNGGVWLDYKGFCWKPPRVRHATPAEIKAGCRLDHSEDVTDTVTDIRNHISPNTKVVEL